MIPPNGSLGLFALLSWWLLSAVATSAAALLAFLSLHLIDKVSSFLSALISQKGVARLSSLHYEMKRGCSSLEAVRVCAQEPVDLGGRKFTAACSTRNDKFLWKKAEAEEVDPI